MEFLDNKHKFIHDVICKAVSNFNSCNNDFMKVSHYLDYSKSIQPDNVYYNFDPLMRYLDLLYRIGVTDETTDIIKIPDASTDFFDILDKYFICINVLYIDTHTQLHNITKFINDTYKIVHLYDDNLTSDDIMMLMYYVPITISNIDVYNDSFFADYKVYKANQHVDIFNILKTGLERIKSYYDAVIIKETCTPSDAVVKKIGDIKWSVMHYMNYNRIMQGEKLDLENPIKDNQITIPEFIPRLKEFLDYLASSGKVYSNNDLTYLQRITNQFYNYMIR